MPDQKQLRWYQKPGLTEATQSALKKANRRLVKLAAEYGQDSNVYKNEIAVFEKDPNWAKYLSKSDPTKNPQYRKGKSKTTAVVDKFDVRKFNQDLRSGNITRMSANMFLMNAAGIRINEDGSTSNVPVTHGVSGIATVSELKRQAKARLERRGEEPGNITAEDIRKETERLAEVSQSFDTEYDDYVASKTESGAKRDRIVKRLWTKEHGGSRDDKEQLSQEELEKIIARMKEINEKNKKKALDFEKKNGGQRKTKRGNR